MEDFPISEAEIRQRIVHDEYRTLERMIETADRIERTEYWLVPLLGATMSLSAVMAVGANWPMSLPWVAGLVVATYNLAAIVTERRERLAKLKQAEENYDLLCLEVHFANSPDE